VLPLPNVYSTYGLYSYETVVKRWPVILTSIINSIHSVNHELSMNSRNQDATDEERIVEGKGLIEKISRLKYQMSRDHPLE
jgi:damage-control phosphatase, subfamily III